MVKRQKNQFIFKVIATSLPFILLILLELTLHLFNYGFETKLFIEDKSYTGYYYTNSHISKLFFSELQDSRTGTPYYFKKEKSPDTFRVFVLGGSSALGYPYTQRASFPRMLEYRLSKAFPERDIEVINLSITAINSWAFLSFADEIAEMNPDAVLVYAGHNEYYGAMGVGSSQGFGSKRWVTKLMVALKKYKTVQMVLNLNSSVKKSFKEKAGQDKGFMHRMAKEQEIIYHSDLYQKGINQFEKNMEELLSKLSKHHIPVYLSSVASNEKDQKPFVSVIDNSSETTSFFNAYKSGMQAYQIGDYEASLKSFLNANQIDSSYAMCHYMIGKILYEEEDYKHAKHYFGNAIELDALRFRAPDEINQCILRLQEKFGNVSSVDSEKKFAKYSVGGITGDNLFVDHLHPNKYGYFLLAEAFYESILKSGQLGPPYQSIATEKAWNNLPVTEVDSIYGDWMCKVMKKQWPFYEDVVFDPDSTESYPELLTNMIFNNMISTDMAMDSLFVYYSKTKDIPNELKVIKSLVLEHPFEWRYPAETANIYNQLKEYNDAAFYYRKAFKLSPSVEMARKTVFALIQADRPEDTSTYLQYLLTVNPGDPLAASLTQKTVNAVKWKKQLEEEPEHMDAILGLAEYYLFVRKTNEAKKHLDLAQSLSPGNNQVEKLQEVYTKLEAAGSRR